MDITLNKECNNNCSFCPRQEFLSLISCNSLKRIYPRINETRKTNVAVFLSGREATLLPKRHMRCNAQFNAGCPGPVFIREHHAIDTLIQTNKKESLYMEKFKRLFSKKPFCADRRFTQS
jgi:hypothetical protein